jgi:hypothetical protein
MMVITGQSTQVEEEEQQIAAQVFSMYRFICCYQCKFIEEGNNFIV